jgi:hypothetical protein
MWEKHCSFSHKTLWIAIVLPYMILFCYDFFKKIIFVDFTGESIVSFLKKHCGLLQCFPS